MAAKHPDTDSRTKLLKAGIVFLIGYLDQEDGDSTVGKACLTDLVEAQRLAPKGKPLTLYISSDGGPCDTGMGICGTLDYIHRSGRKTVGHVIGTASSFGLAILQHCSVRIAEHGADIMGHEIQLGVEGSTTNVFSVAVQLKKIFRTQMELGSDRTGKPVSYFEEKMKVQDCFLSAEEALYEGLLDKVEERVKF